MNFKMKVEVLKDENLGATGWSARSERIANIARGARADCSVVPRLQHHNHMDELFLSGFKILLLIPGTRHSDHKPGHRESDSCSRSKPGREGTRCR